MIPNRLLLSRSVPLRDTFGATTGQALVCTPLLAEQLALKGALAPLPVYRTGMGPQRSRESARRLSSRASAVLVAGVAGALQPELRPGDVVVARSVWGDAGAHRIVSPSAELLAAALRRCGLTVHTGAVLCTPRLLRERSRRELAKTGALAVEMESIDLAAICSDGPFAAVRVVVDTPREPLMRSGTVVRGIEGLRALRAAAPAIAQWVAAVRPRVVTCGADAACDVVLDVRHSGGDATAPRNGARNGAAAGGAEAEAGAGAGFASRTSPPTYRVKSAADIDLRWLAGAARVGLLVDEATPSRVADEIVAALSGLGQVRYQDVAAGRGPERTPTREVT